MASTPKSWRRARGEALASPRALIRPPGGHRGRQERRCGNGPLMGEREGGREGGGVGWLAVVDRRRCVVDQREKHLCVCGTICIYVTVCACQTTKTTKRKDGAIAIELESIASPDASARRRTCWW
jgi:hypothetical protein